MLTTATTAIGVIPELGLLQERCMMTPICVATIPRQPTHQSYGIHLCVVRGTPVFLKVGLRSRKTQYEGLADYNYERVVLCTPRNVKKFCF